MINETCYVNETELGIDMSSFEECLARHEVIKNMTDGELYFRMSKDNSFIAIGIELLIKKHRFVHLLPFIDTP